MSWKWRYKNLFKTSNPNLIITAIQSFPNLYNTIEKNVELFKTKELQSDSKLLEIMSLHGLLVEGNGFIPLYFEDDCPKLSKLRNLKPKDERKYDWFWCICYVYPGYEGLGKGVSKINLPKHQRFCELLEYSIKELDGRYCEFLFNWSIKTYISEQTRNFNEVERYNHYKLGSEVLFDWRYDKIKSEGLEFIDNMYSRNIYELMFNILRK